MHIEAKELKKVFDGGPRAISALAGLSFEARPGEILGILGPNGSGKTTTIRILLNLVTPDSGVVMVDGEAAGNTTAGFRAKLGYLPEATTLYRKRSISEQFRFFGALKGLPASEAVERGEKILQAFEIKSRSDDTPDRLSKGLVQRACIATALLHEPRLVILDEPFSGLDPIATQLLRELLVKLKTEGKTLIISTHRMSEAEKVCDKVLLIAHGKKVFYDDLLALRGLEENPFWTIDSLQDLNALPCVEWTEHTPGGQTICLRATASVSDLLRGLAEREIKFSKLERRSVPLEEIYIRMVKKKERQ